MTDVTGFGLAAHLRSMLSMSGVGASLDGGSIPIFDGALELSNDGVRSHLYESNVAAVDVIADHRDPRSKLIYDPQTAGGLLAAVPEAEAAGVVEALRLAGFTDSAVIGTITQDPGALVYGTA